MNGTRQNCKDRAFDNALCTQHHLSPAHFFSLQVVCPLFKVVCQRARTSACFSNRFHNAHALAQAQQLKFVSVVSRVFGKKTHLHPCYIHFPCCTRSATLTCTSPLHLPAHLLLRHFRDQLRRHFSRKAQLRREVCSLALWSTRTSSQVVSPRMTWTMTRKSHLSSSLTSTTTNPISSLILVFEGNQTFRKSGIRQAAASTVFNPCNFCANP